jgi:hypothetical protein
MARNRDLEELKQACVEFGRYYNRGHACEYFPAARRVVITLEGGGDAARYDFARFVAWADKRNIAVDIVRS